MRYSTEDIMAATGLSADDIKNYVRRELLSHPIDPPEHGKQRLYDRESVIDFAMLDALSKAGVPLATAKAWVTKLLPMLKKKSAPIAILWEPGADKFIPLHADERDLANVAAFASNADAPADNDELAIYLAMLKAFTAGQIPSSVSVSTLGIKKLIQHVDKVLSECVKNKKE